MRKKIYSLNKKADLLMQRVNYRKKKLLACDMDMTIINVETINLINKEGRLTVDTLKWNGQAKKAGIETDDVITEFKIENLDRPNKAIIYPFSFLLILIFGYNNYRRKLE